MQFSIVTALALLAAVAQAAPTPAVEARQFQVQVRFEGAAGAYFPQSFPSDGTLVAISM